MHPLVSLLPTMLVDGQEGVEVDLTMFAKNGRTSPDYDTVQVCVANVPEVTIQQ